MIGNDAQIHFRVCTETFYPDEWLTIFQAELEFLLVYGSRRFQGGFDPFAEPRLFNVVLRDILCGFALPVYALCLSVSKGNDHAERFTCRDQFFDFLLVERQCRPASIQTVLLSEQDNLFAIVCNSGTHGFADPECEAQVQQAFREMAKGRTVIMIAHRLSTVRNADRIYVLKDGQLEERGKHDDLMDKNGLYAAMWTEYRKAVNWKVGEAV